MENAGVLTRGEKLQDGTGRVLRRTLDHTSITDGPYTESKEVIGGLFEIQADNYEKAVEAASAAVTLNTEPLRFARSRFIEKGNAKSMRSGLISF